MNRNFAVGLINLLGILCGSNSDDFQVRLGISKNVSNNNKTLRNNIYDAEKIKVL